VHHFWWFSEPDSAFFGLSLSYFISLTIMLLWRSIYIYYMPK